ncbi:MAG: alkane 1-monooxygenase, partial [Sulfitobacter sp.]|nr:alkane 1-monooxygenase [Sulfitobacter sp.]
MQNTTIAPTELARLSRALPFWLSLGLIPLAWLAAIQGGWTIALLPIVTWFLFSLLDAVLGLNFENADLDATESDMFWYRLVTLIWVP